MPIAYFSKKTGAFCEHWNAPDDCKTQCKRCYTRCFDHRPQVPGYDDCGQLFFVKREKMKNKLKKRKTTDPFPIIKIGNKVSDLNGMTGTVTEVLPFNPLNPIEEHGCVTVKVITHPYLKKDDEDHYIHSNWFEFLKIT